MQKILVLEDDLILAKTLVGGLGSPKAQAAAVHTLEDFYEYIESKRVDLCVMDRLIGEQDSLEALGYVRDIMPRAKVLLLSKKSAVLDRIRGLEEGADDYLAKPFSLAELRLRVRGLLLIDREPRERKGIDLGPLKFFPDQGVIETPEKKIFLRKREVEILMCLNTTPDNFVLRRTVTRWLWPVAYEPSTSTVDVYIRRLRQKLGEYESILETRRGFGYRLVVNDGKDGANRRPAPRSRS